MRSLRILLALVVLRTAVATLGYSIELTAAQEAATTEIAKLGGRTTVDQTAPGEPVALSQPVLRLLAVISSRI